MLWQKVFEGDTFKKTPAVNFFDTREEAVARCAKELTFNDKTDPWVPAMKAAIEQYFAKDPENHYPLSNIFCQSKKCPG